MQSSQLDWETSNKNQTSNVEDAIRNSETDCVLLNPNLNQGAGSTSFEF